jgi:hypothetical protein
MRWYKTRCCGGVVKVDECGTFYCPVCYEAVVVTDEVPYEED